MKANIIFKTIKYLLDLSFAITVFAFSLPRTSSQWLLLQISNVSTTFRTIASSEPRKILCVCTPREAFCLFLHLMFASDVVIQDGRFMYAMENPFKVGREICVYPIVLSCATVTISGHNRWKCHYVAVVDGTTVSSRLRGKKIDS